MGYFPEVGDAVVINPKMESYLQAYFNIKAQETPVRVCEVKDHFDHDDLFLVILEPKITGASSGFAIDKDGVFYVMRKDPNPPSLFVKVEATGLQKPSNLKQLNTDGRLNCAACGDLLKQPVGLGIQYRHCPRCEP